MNIDKILNNPTIQKKMLEMGEKALIMPLQDLIKLVKVEPLEKCIITIADVNGVLMVSLVIMEQLKIKKVVAKLKFSSLLKNPKGTIENVTRNLTENNHTILENN